MPQTPEELAKIQEYRIRNLESDIVELRKINVNYKEFIRLHIDPAIRSVTKFELQRLHDLISSGHFKVPHEDKVNIVKVASIIVEDEFRKYIGGDWMPEIKVVETIPGTLDEIFDQDKEPAEVPLEDLEPPPEAPEE